MDTLFLLLLLQFKHWYADFVIQTYQQTVRKGIYRDPVGISHSLDHVWTSLVILLLFSITFTPIHPLLIIAIAFAEGILHYHIDWFKVHYGCKDMTKPLFWNQFGQDQLAHQVTYLCMCYIILHM